MASQIKLNYIITDDLYAEVIAYQMRLHNNRGWRIAWYIISNLLFCGAAIYFLIMRPQYSWPVRLGPIAMAVILLVLSTSRRVNLPKRAKSALKRYKRDGTLEEDFIGPHTLIVEGGRIRLGFGKNWKDASCDEYGGFLELAHSECLIVHGVIFDLIPKETLNSEGNREKLRNALSQEDSEVNEKANEKKEEFEETAVAQASWNVDKNIYVRGMVKGHRMYYRTRQAWLKLHQIIRVIILIYGLVVFCARINIYIGLAFVLIGIILNRQLIISFTPYAYQIVWRQTAQIWADREPGQETFYISKGNFSVLLLDQSQTTKLSDISARLQDKEFSYVFTSIGQMYVLPHAMFHGEKEEHEFLHRLGWKK